MRLIALLTLACAPVLAAPRASIELLPVPQVAGAATVLGQVARIHSAELALVRELVHLPLPPSPHAQQVLARSELAAAVARQLHLGDDDIAWSGADSTRVAKPASRIQADAIVQAATAAIADLLRSRGLGAEVRLRSRPRDTDVFADARLLVRPVADLPLRRSMVVWVDVLAGDRLARSVPVSFELAWAANPYAERPAAERPQTPGAFLAATVDAPTVARGDWATLRANAGPILLESRVEVLQDGRPGDRVRVRQPGAAGMVFARVIGKGQVELAP